MSYYKKRAEFNSDNWATKQKYDVIFNTICFSEQFKSYISNRFGICPCGLTFDTLITKNNTPEFVCCVKNYGIESISNNGTNGTDLGDYEYNAERPVSPEMFYGCLDYINTNNNELLTELSKYEIFC